MPGAADSYRSSRARCQCLFDAEEHTGRFGHCTILCHHKTCDVGNDLGFRRTAKENHLPRARSCRPAGEACSFQYASAIPIHRLPSGEYVLLFGFFTRCGAGGNPDWNAGGHWVPSPASDCVSSFDSICAEVKGTRRLRFWWVVALF